MSETPRIVDTNQERPLLTLAEIQEEIDHFYAERGIPREQREESQGRAVREQKGIADVIGKFPPPTKKILALGILALTGLGVFGRPSGAEAQKNTSEEVRMERLNNKFDIAKEAKSEFSRTDLDAIKDISIDFWDKVYHSNSTDEELLSKYLAEAAGKFIVQPSYEKLAQTTSNPDMLSVVMYSIITQAEPYLEAAGITQQNFNENQNVRVMQKHIKVLLKLLPPVI